MPAAYLAADVIVSASTDPEAFGRVSVEAQAMGRRVIATDHGGSAETVVNGKTGWLVPPAQPDALADALGHVLAQTEANCDDIARRAMAHVRTHFSREVMCARTLAVYNELLPPGPSFGQCGTRRRKASD